MAEKEKIHSRKSSRESPKIKNIFNATEVDLTTIIELNEQFHLDIPNFKWDKARWISEEIKKGTFFVLKDEDLVIGAICLKPAKDELRIETIAIRKDFQGLSHGKTLIQFARDEAKRQTKFRLTVESFCSYNLGEFYKKCGFKVDDPPIGYFKNQPYSRFFMNFPG